MRSLIVILCTLAGAMHAYETVTVTPRADATGPRVLCIVAHPDDEISFAGTLYKITTHLDGLVDIALITNGEGGFKYSTLAESIYGLELTDEAVGRRELPHIRRTEMIEGCRIMQVHRLFMFYQQDHRYTRDPNEVLAEDAGVWDLDLLRASFAEMVADYDVILTHLPIPQTHGHHQAATILALEAVAALPADQRPVILGEGRNLEDFTERDGWPITRLAEQAEAHVFDRTQPLGYKDRLNYQIVVNWVITAHKSQGTMQLAVSATGREHYWRYACNTPEAEAQVQALFARLAEPQFPARTYDESAGLDYSARPPAEAAVTE